MTNLVTRDFPSDGTVQVHLVADTALSEKSVFSLKSCTVLRTSQSKLFILLLDKIHCGKVTWKLYEHSNDNDGCGGPRRREVVHYWVFLVKWVN
jgi:hypothetical protein